MSVLCVYVRDREGGQKVRVLQHDGSFSKIEREMSHDEYGKEKSMSGPLTPRSLVFTKDYQVTPDYL